MLVALVVCSGEVTLRGASGELHVRITSPLGRTGTVGMVRIVAQIDRPTGGDGGRRSVLCRRHAAAHDRLAVLPTRRSGWTLTRSTAASWL